MHDSGSGESVRGRKMRREQLEQMLGKKVDKVKYTGILIETRDRDNIFRDPSVFNQWKYYFLTDETNQISSVFFRACHVQKCKVIE